MADVTIHVEQETAQCLAEKAKQGGQTLESYLEQLVQHHVQAGVGANDTGEGTDDDDSAERPWRGIFVPQRPRNVLFRKHLPLVGDQLPKRKASLNMNWHRTVSDDE